MDPTKAAWSYSSGINYEFAVLLSTAPVVPYGTHPGNPGQDFADIYKVTGPTMQVSFYAD